MLSKQESFLEELYLQYFKKLVLYAISVLKDPSRAQDVVQDTFHEAILHIDKLMTHENPGGWLMQTTKNKIRESERARRRYLLRFLSLDSELSVALVPQGNEINVAQFDTEETSAMEKIQQVLTAEEYQILKRFTIDKASHLEIAQELGISVWTSQKRIERIREKLRKVFPERKKKKEMKK